MSAFDFQVPVVLFSKIQKKMMNFVRKVQTLIGSEPNFVKEFPTEKRSVFPHCFNVDRWQTLHSVEEIETLTMNNPAPTSLKVLTFNIWFDQYFNEQRTRAITDIIQQHDPDVICLQEVTTRSIQYVCASTFIRQHYFASDSPDDDYSSVHPYGVWMGVKKNLPIKRIFFNTLPSGMCRAALSVEFQKSSMVVTTVHLESLDNTELRYKQLSIIAKFQRAYKNAVLCGDFNFDSERNYTDYLPYLENDFLKTNMSEYVDVWQVLKYPELGKTFDTTTNKMISNHQTEVMRYDRIILASAESKWKAADIQMIGNQAIYVGQEYQNSKVYPSDHYGLVTTITSQ